MFRILQSAGFALITTMMDQVMQELICDALRKQVVYQCAGPMAELPLCRLDQCQHSFWSGEVEDSPEVTHSKSCIVYQPVKRSWGWTGTHAWRRRMEWSS